MSIDDIGRLHRAGLAAQAAGDRAAAIAAFRGIEAIEPGHLDALYLLGTLYAESGELQLGLDYLERARRQAPGSPYILNNLGTLQRLLGNVEQAIAAYRSACALAPEFIDARANLGAVLLRHGDPAEAIALLEAVVRERPDWEVPVFNLGAAFRRTGAHESAIGCFQRALTLRPGNPRTLEALALTCFAAGRLDEARDHARAWSESVPPGAAADSEMPLLMARIGDCEVPERYPPQAAIETYRRKAATWDEDIRRPGMEFFGPALIEAAVSRLGLPAATAAVLDLGCGTGACAPFLRPLARRIVGVDLSPEMVERAARRYDEVHCADLAGFLEGQGREAFDLVVASGVLILFGDLAGVLAAIAGRLSPGGFLVFTLYRSDGAAVAVRDNLHFAHGRNHIEQRCAEAGLAVLALEEVVHERDSGVPQAGWCVTARRA